MWPFNKQAKQEPAVPDIPTVVDPGAPVPTESKPERVKPRNLLIWAIAGSVGLLFTIVLALLIIGVNLIISSTKNLNTAPPPEPPKIEIPVEPPPKVSKYATDSAVLGIKESLNKLRSDIDANDPFEPQLAPPSLDLSVNIPPSQ